MINGQRYDWASIEINIDGIRIAGAQSITYMDERALESRYGVGSDIIGVARGNYKASCSLEMDREDYEELKKQIDPLFETTFNIIVSYDKGDGIVVDTLNNVNFTKVDTSSKQEDSNASMMKLECSVNGKILFNGKAHVN